MCVLSMKMHIWNCRMYTLHFAADPGFSSLSAALRIFQGVISRFGAGFKRKHSNRMERTGQNKQ